jgi:chromosomal replication initiation ATPase DnaA
MDKLKFTQVDTIDQELFRFSKSISNGCMINHQTKPDSPEAIAHQIIEQTAVLFGVNLSELKSTSRLRPIPQIRQVLMWYFRYQLGMTTISSAAMFGKNHSTCIHACMVVDNRATDFVMSEIYDKFIQAYQ